MLSRLIKTKLQAKLIMYLRTRYTMINVVPVQGMFNCMCHDNAVQWAKSRARYGIAEVIYIDQGVPILHYINTKDGEFYETTLGWRAEDLEYYKIRDIHPSDWNSIHSEFSRSLDSWLLQFTNWYHRNVLNIKRVL